MQNLIDFFEKETNKKINIFKYNNEKITNNQNIVEFNNTAYVIEFIKNNTLTHVNGYCYLFSQPNLDFYSLENILHNLYEDIQIYMYNNYLLLISDNILDINNTTPTIIESETYSKTHIIFLDKINTIDDLEFKIKMVDELINIIINDNTNYKFVTLNDLIIYKVVSITSYDKYLSSLIKFDIIKNMDENLLNTGINFIENGLNISRTSNILFLHRNTLIYRLEKIKEYLNLDLKNFKDAFLFYLSVKAFFSILNDNK